MVNVNAQIPFNLHNQNLGGLLGPSSSRSHSAGANANSNQNSRQPSPSPGPSLHMSRSSGSLQHLGDVIDNEPKKPILNVRLVRGVGTRRASSSRVRGRLGRFGEESGREVYIGGDGSSQRGEMTHDDECDDGQDDAEDLVTPRPPDMVPQWARLQEMGAVSANARASSLDKLSTCWLTSFYFLFYRTLQLKFLQCHRIHRNMDFRTPAFSRALGVTSHLTIVFADMP